MEKSSKLIGKYYKQKLEEKPDFPWEDKGKQEIMAENRHFREKSRKKQEKKAGLSLGNLLDKSCFSIRETV